MPDQWAEQRRELTEATREMYRRGLVGAYSGNTSLRLSGAGDDGLLLVTPTHHPYYRLQPEELVVVNLDGEPIAPAECVLRPKPACTWKSTATAMTSRP